VPPTRQYGLIFSIKTGDRPLLTTDRPTEIANVFQIVLEILKARIKIFFVEIEFYSKWRRVY